MSSAHSTTSTQRTLSLLAVTTVMTASLLLIHAPRVLAQATPEVTSETTAPTEVVLTAIPPRLGDDLALKAAPGQTIQTSVRVRNSSSVDQTVETLVEDFIIGEDGEQPIPVAEETASQWSLASWITLAPSRQIVKANETAVVNVIIEVPADAYPGGRYAMIMHQPISGQESLGSSSGVSQRVGTLLYFQVDGPINEEAYVSPIEVPGLSEFGPVPFSFAIDNRSDIHIRPNVTMEISNMLGQPVETLTLETKNIFPYTSRDFEATWQRVWGFGRYTAEVSVTYGSQGKTAVQSVSFWLIPVKLLLAIGVSLSTIAVIGLLVRRHLLHRSDSQAKKIEMLEEKLRMIESDQEQKFRDDNH